MAKAWAKLEALGREVQPLVTAWLVVALILPSLLGLVPSAKANPAQGFLQLSELQLCAQLGHLPDGADKAKQKHDCPCCLPSAAGLVALPPLEPTPLQAVSWHSEKLVLVAFNLRRLAGQPHHLAPARAPPAILAV